MNEYKLSDEVIAHIAQCLQLAILTQTDIVDNLRMLRLEKRSEEDFSLYLSETYTQQANENLNKMVEQAQEMAMKLAQELGTDDHNLM